MVLPVAIISSVIACKSASVISSGRASASADAPPDTSIKTRLPSGIERMRANNARPASSEC
jgi:hypothetical protein